MKVYIASDVANPAKISELKAELEQLNFEVTTTWAERRPFPVILNDLEEGRKLSKANLMESILRLDKNPNPTLIPPPLEDEALDFYSQCRADIGSSELVISLANEPGSWQVVVAESLGIPVMIVGTLSEPCHFGPNVIYRATGWEHAKGILLRVRNASTAKGEMEASR